MKELTLMAENTNLDCVLEFINKEMEAANFGMKQIMQVDVAVEEIFTNIANYAYKPKVGEATIRCHVEQTGGGLMIEFIDGGVQYNPLKKENPDISLCAEERKIGGLGIYMTKKLMDSMEYHYQDGKNILIVRKQI